MDYQQAYIKWRHEWTGKGYLCPITKQIVPETYSDFSRTGTDTDEEGAIIDRTVFQNACAKCADPGFTIARDMRRLIARRKKAAEGARAK